jgi:PAS domain S-box-containing protein
MQPQDLGIGRLFESVRDAVVVAETHTGEIVLWNPAATEIFGYSLSEALKLRIDALVPEHLKTSNGPVWLVTGRRVTGRTSTRVRC